MPHSTMQQITAEIHLNLKANGVRNLGATLLLEVIDPVHVLYPNAVRSPPAYKCLSTYIYTYTQVKNWRALAVPLFWQDRYRAV